MANAIDLALRSLFIFESGYITFRETAKICSMNLATLAGYNGFFSLQIVVNAMSSTFTMLVVLVASASVAMSNMGESQKPNMPHVFQNEKQLSQYLQALDDYYMLLGKPRFGRSFQDGAEYKRWNSPYAEFLRTF